MSSFLRRCLPGNLRRHGNELTVPLAGLANGVISPMQKSLLTQSAPGKLRGGMVSADRILMNISKTISPLFAGLVLGLSNVEGVFRTLGAIALIWVVSVVVLLMRGYLRPPPNSCG